MGQCGSITKQNDVNALSDQIADLEANQKELQKKYEATQRLLERTDEALAICVVPRTLEELDNLERRLTKAFIFLKMIETGP